MAISQDIIVKSRASLVINDRHVRMFQMIADDTPRSEIAKKLKLSIRTLEADLDKVRNGLGCKNTAAAIAILFRKGIIK